MSEKDFRRAFLPVLVLLLSVAVCTAKKTKDPTVHIVFSNHLDIGFNGLPGDLLGTDDNVINTYFDVYFPKAVSVAEELLKANGTERLIWTTHSYLVSLYLDCPKGMGFHCPNEAAVKAFSEAVVRGDITWHAFPHNAQLEVFDEDLLRFAVGLTHGLDKKFGLPSKITLSQRDVPGFTRAALPILYEAGVRALSFGVNGGSAPPGVPKNKPFIWRDEGTATDMLAMLHPGGYSGSPVDDVSECIQWKGFDHILCSAWRGDNAGPHDSAEVLDIFARVRAAFPHATVTASTLDAFAGPLLEAAPKLGLEVVTQEVGDTWIHGIASDADKLSEFRAMLRARRAYANKYGDEAFQNFSRLLTKIPEHTWGVDIKKSLADYTHWSNKDLHEQLNASNPAYMQTVASWARQRAYIRWALEALGESEPALVMWRELNLLQELKVQPTPAEWGFTQLDTAALPTFTSPAWQLRLSPATGALASLRAVWDAGKGEGGLGLDWAAEERQLGLPMYSTYNEQDYSMIWDSYAWLNELPDWFQQDFGKLNCSEAASTRREDLTPKLEEVWQLKSGKAGFRLLVKSSLPKWAVQDAGAPVELWADIRAPDDSSCLYYDVIWVNKTRTRLPEAFWVRFMPPNEVADPNSWQMYKLGRPISPLEVILNGSQSLHAVGDEGVSVMGSSKKAPEQLFIRSLDAALVSPGVPYVFPQIRFKPDMTQGVSFNLANNIWGTNYVMWQPYLPDGERMRFRFILQAAQASKGRLQAAAATGPTCALTEGTSNLHTDA